MQVSSSEGGLSNEELALADNLQHALAEYTQNDQTTKPLGRNVSEAVDLVQQLLGSIREALAGFDWRSRIDPRQRHTFAEAALGTTNFLHDPATKGNQVADGEERLADRYRQLSAQLARAWALCTGTDELAPVRTEVQFYEEVRVYMAKFDAEDRRASGKPIPEDIERLLAAVIADITQTGDVVDIYEAAGLPKPELTELNPEFVAKAQQAKNPHLAIEALRKLVLEEASRVTRSNVIRERAF